MSQGAHEGPVSEGGSRWSAPVVPRRGHAALLPALLCALLAGGPALAQTGSDVRGRLDQAEQKLREKRAAEQALSADVRQIQDERARLNSNLVETAKLIQQGEGRLTAIEGRMGELEAQERLLKGSLSERHGVIVHLLAAMQRMGRDPPPVMITRRQDALVMVRSAMMLASAFPQLKEQAKALGDQLADLGRVMGEIKGEVDKQRAETAQLTEARTRLSELLESKRQSLNERQTELDRVRREAIEIARNVTDMNELIARLDKVVTRETAIAPASPRASEARPAIALASPPADLAPATPPIASPGGPAAVVLAPQGTQLANLNPGRIKPAMPFASAKGRLPLPAQGRRVIAFGDKAQTSRSNGIVIETRAGGQVIAPMDGWIVFAGVFRSYGQIVIINGGDGYHMLLAGLSQIDVQLGQFVLAGEPVGLMAGAPRGAAAKQPQNAPVLYVELRKDGRSIDPDPWWMVESPKKVQG